MSPEISGGIFPEISGKIGLLFRNFSAEKFRTFLAANLIKNHKKCQVFELSLCRKETHNKSKAYSTRHYKSTSTGWTMQQLAICYETWKTVDSLRISDFSLQLFRNFSGIFPEKFRKNSGILLFRKSYNPIWRCL